MKNPDAVTDYLKAILFNRMGNADDAAQALKAAIAKDSKWATYAADDLELSKIAK